jgi:hypothetical protein
VLARCRDIMKIMPITIPTTTPMIPKRTVFAINLLVPFEVE